MAKEKSSSPSKSSVKKSKYWAAISWCDSEPKDIFDLAKKSSIECCCILHDKDFNELATPIDYSGEVLETGQHKKTHRHWIFAFPNPTTPNHAQTIILEITNGTIPIPISNIKGSYAYLVHKHDPDKYQYSTDDISYFNGFVPENYINLGAGEEDQATIAIENIIEQFGFEEYSVLVRYLRENNNDLARFLTSHTIHFSAYLRSKHQAKRQVKKDKLLDLQIQAYEQRMEIERILHCDRSDGEIV